MRRFGAAAVFYLAAGVAGCAHVPRYENHRPGHVATVHLWVQRHPHLPTEDVLRGCELWMPKGIRCISVSEKKHADIAVVPILRPCAPGPDYKTTLAYASDDGEISVITDCFVGDDGKLDAQKFQAVMGHEVGHELGIWKHVPLECEKSVVICGRALMNPVYDPTVDFITPVDALAFDNRDMRHAVVKDDGAPPDMNRPKETGGLFCEYATYDKLRFR